jgi:hypothetical protein
MPRNGDANVVHGESQSKRNGRKEKGIYGIWRTMKSRCEHSNDQAFHNYGKRGITVHPDWSQSYVAFRDWIYTNLGERPSRQYSLDRIDTNGNYEPGNVRWSTRAEQARNKRNTKLSPASVEQIKNMVYAGQSHRAVAALFGVHQCTVSRVVNGLRWAA